MSCLSVGVALDGLQRVETVLLGHARRCLEEVSPSEHRVHRCPSLMEHGGEKLILCSACLLRFRDRG